MSYTKSYTIYPKGPSKALGFILTPFPVNLFTGTLNWKVVKFLHDEFAKSGDRRLCTLRAELLMAMHDTEIDDVTRQDPCHNLAWTLDAGLAAVGCATDLDRKERIEAERLRAE